MTQIMLVTVFLQWQATTTTREKNAITLIQNSNPSIGRSYVLLDVQLQ